MDWRQKTDKQMFDYLNMGPHCTPTHIYFGNIKLLFLPGTLGYVDCQSISQQGSFEYVRTVRTLKSFQKYRQTTQKPQGVRQTLYKYIRHPTPKIDGKLKCVQTPKIDEDDVNYFFPPPMKRQISNFVFSKLLFLHTRTSRFFHLQPRFNSDK